MSVSGVLNEFVSEVDKILNINSHDSSVIVSITKMIRSRLKCLTDHPALSNNRMIVWTLQRLTQNGLGSDGKGHEKPQQQQ
jgi:hypothetical protein